MFLSRNRSSCFTNISILHLFTVVLYVELCMLLKYCLDSNKPEDTFSKFRVLSAQIPWRTTLRPRTPHVVELVAPEPK